MVALQGLLDSKWKWHTRDVFFWGSSKEGPKNTRHRKLSFHKKLRRRLVLGAGISYGGSAPGASSLLRTQACSQRLRQNVLTAGSDGICTNSSRPPAGTICSLLPSSGSEALQLPACAGFWHLPSSQRPDGSPTLLQRSTSLPGLTWKDNKVKREVKPSPTSPSSSKLDKNQHWLPHLHYFSPSRKDPEFSKFLLHITFLKPLLTLVAAASWPLSSISSTRAFISGMPYFTYLAPSDLRQSTSTLNWLRTINAASFPFPVCNPKLCSELL